MYLQDFCDKKGREVQVYFYAHFSVMVVLQFTQGTTMFASKVTKKYAVKIMFEACDRLFLTGLFWNISYFPIRRVQWKTI